MSLKNKIFLVLVSVFTLGLYWFFIWYQVKNQKIKVIVNVEKLKKILGGEKNIINVEYSGAKVKIFLKDVNVVNIDIIKDIKGISGVYISSKYLTIVVGSSAKQIAKKLI